MSEISETKLRILELATRPSRYSELEKGSGVSKSIFNKHLNDLLREGLIEKMEEGLYVITPKGLEILLIYMEEKRRGMLRNVFGRLFPSREEYPEEVVNVLLGFINAFSSLVYNVSAISLFIEVIAVNPVSEDRRLETLNLVEICNSIVENTYLLTLYLIEKLKKIPKKYVRDAIKYLTSIIQATAKLSEEYTKKQKLVLPYETTRKVIQDYLEEAKKAIEKVREEASELEVIANMLKEKDLVIESIYIKQRLEEINKKIEEALNMFLAT